MASDLKPFDKLGRDEQQVAIELSAVACVLITRLPSLSQDIFSLISREFVSQYDLPSVIGRSVLRHLGQELFENPWSFSVFKDLDNNIRTEFTFVDKNQAGNGEMS